MLLVRRFDHDPACHQSWKHFFQLGDTLAHPRFHCFGGFQVMEGKFQRNIHGDSPSYLLSYTEFNRQRAGSAPDEPAFRSNFQSIFVRKSNDNLLIFKYIPAVSDVIRNIACTMLSISSKTVGQN
jgi:hypothetical protein